MEIKLKLN